MQVSYNLEFDTDESADRVRTALDALGGEPPFPRFRLHDRTARFAIMRALFDNQRQMNQAEVPVVVRVISAFIHFVVVPSIIAIAWIFALPGKLMGSDSNTTSDLQRFVASSERPMAFSAVPFVVEQLSRRLGCRNVVIATAPLESDHEDTQHARRERLALSDLMTADEERLAQLVGARIEVLDR